MDSLFPDFFLMSRVLGEFDDVFWCQFFIVHTEETFSNKNLETRNPIAIDSFNIVTDPFAPPFFDFLFDFPPVSTCRTWHLSSCTHAFLQTCNSDTREDDRIHMTCFFYRIWMEFRTFSLKSFPLYWLFSLRIFVPLRQFALPSNGTQEKTIGSSFSSLFFVTVIRGCCVMTDNCMNLLWKHCQCVIH